MRAKAYYDREEELGTSATSKALAQYRIDWMIVQARTGMEEKTISAVKELISLASTTTEADGEIAPTSIYKHAAASMGMLSSTLTQSNPSAAAKYQDNAMRLLEKAILAGYRDIAYLKTDPDFDWLQNDRLMAQVEAMIQKAEREKQ